MHSIVSHYLSFHINTIYLANLLWCYYFLFEFLIMLLWITELYHANLRFLFSISQFAFRDPRFYLCVCIFHHLIIIHSAAFDLLFFAKLIVFQGIPACSGSALMLVALVHLDAVFKVRFWPSQILLADFQFYPSLNCLFHFLWFFWIPQSLCFSFLIIPIIYQHLNLTFSSLLSLSSFIPKVFIILNSILYQ